MTDEQARSRARELYGSDELEIDADAKVSHLDEDGPVKGYAWVQAWVLVPAVEASDASPS